MQAWLLRKQLQDEPRLAHTVRDLSHLAELVKVLPTTAELNTEAYRFASAIDRSLVAEQYIESLAELCPNLEAVTTSLRNRDQAVRLGTSLSATKSLKSMKCKVFGDPRNLDAFFEALAKPNGAPLVQEVELEFRGLHHHAEPETPGGQPYTTSKLTFHLNLELGRPSPTVCHATSPRCASCASAATPGLSIIRSQRTSYLALPATA